MKDSAKNLLNSYIYAGPPKNIQLPIYVRMNEYADI